MKNFMDRDFLLETETGKRLFHEDAEGLPIYDFHNHLSPEEIYDDLPYHDLTEAWLAGDHYKWRAMRANGIPEQIVRGEGVDPYDRFLAWADTVENCIGNPLYAWTHLELQRYFGITTPLSRTTAPAIWKECNEKLRTPEYSVRNLLRRMNVKVLCTTDDPADDLRYHQKLQAEETFFQVFPSFRPEKAMNIEKEDFPDYLNRLSEVSNTDCSTPEGIIKALEKRLDFFVSMGCRVSDHSIEGPFFRPATEREVREILEKRLAGGTLSPEECGKYRGFLLTALGKMYADRDIVMQLHIGALRNNSERLYASEGADAGFDSVNDFACAGELSAFLNELDRAEKLPRMILYYLNPKDAWMLAAMAGNFQSNDRGIRSRIQLGSAWWFQDHRMGMEYQLDVLANTGLLSGFIGMLTDSRSFLSFSRHEYFRRILCNKVGKYVENGEYPDDEHALKKLIGDICCGNAITFFRF